MKTSPKQLRLSNLLIDSDGAGVFSDKDTRKCKEHYVLSLLVSSFSPRTSL